MWQWLADLLVPDRAIHYSRREVPWMRLTFADGIKAGETIDSRTIAARWVVPVLTTEGLVEVTYLPMGPVGDEALEWLLTSCT